MVTPVVPLLHMHDCAGEAQLQNGFVTMVFEEAVTT